METSFLQHESKIVFDFFPVINIVVLVEDKITMAKKFLDNVHIAKLLLKCDE